MSLTRGVECSIEKGHDEGMEAPRLAHTDLWLKGGGHKERMVAQLDRLDSGVRRVSPHRHAVPSEERDILLRESVAAPVKALEWLLPADVRQARPRNRRD